MCRSNPLAGTDATLLALSGAGYADSKCFGFASCERRAGAAEGVNVLMERRLKRADGDGYEYVYNVTNVEYTEFGRLGVSDECLDGSQYSRYPANTNVLYIGLKASLSPSTACQLITANQTECVRIACASHADAAKLWSVSIQAVFIVGLW